MKNRILFVEQTQDLSDILRIYLENNYYVSYSPTEKDAEHKLENIDNIKLIMYNDDLPEYNGIEFCKNIRKNGFKTPFILLSEDKELKKELEIIKNTLFLPKHSEIEAILQIIQTLIPMEQKEKRQFPRIDINKPFKLKNLCSGETYSGNLSNLSIGGMKVDIKNFSNNFDNTNLEISIDDVKITLNNVHTVYSDTKSADSIVMGIEFKEMNSETYQKIQDIISTIIMDRIISKGSIN